MANNHKEHGQSILDYEEHARIGGLDGKKVFIFDNSGNQITSFGGGSGNATVDINNVVSVASINGQVAIKGNLTLSDPKGFIGLVTVVGDLTANVGMQTLFPGPNQIGSVTVSNQVSANLVGNVTLTDSKGFIGLTSVSGFTNPLPVDATGQGDIPITLDSEPVVLDNSVANIGFATIFQASSARTITGNLTLSDSKTFIGLTTTVVGSSIPAGANAIGIVTVANPSSFTGNITLDDGSLTGIVGNVTLSDSKGFIGLTTVIQASSARTITGNLTLSDSKAFIGLTTTVVGSAIPTGANHIGIVTVANPSSFTGNVTLDDGSLTGIVGNVTVSDSKNFIGLVSVSGFANPLPVTFSGNVTLDDGSLTGIVGNVTLSDPKTGIGLVSIFGGKVDVASTATIYAIVNTAAAGQSSVVLDNSIANIGFATVKIASNVNTNIGLVTIDGGTSKSLVSLGASPNYIGLVTAVNLNAGTTKTIIPKSIFLSSSSILTVAVPTGGNAIFKTTNLLINSNATVRVSIKSGATYLTGNASIGVTLNPGGGWVETGSPDSPTFLGLASGAALVVEKFDMTATKADVGGKVLYYQE